MIQVVCPNGGITVIETSGISPGRAADEQECNNAATYTFTAREYTLQKGLRVYVSDGAEGYFPYTIVASASS